MRAKAHITVLMAMAAVPLAGAQGAAQVAAKPAATPPAKAAAHGSARTPLVKPEESWDSLFVVHPKVGASPAAVAAGAVAHGAASETARVDEKRATPTVTHTATLAAAPTTPRHDAAHPAAQVETSSTPKQRPDLEGEASADAAMVARVHAWQAAQRDEEAERETAARLAVHTADTTMRSGATPSDPVLWSAEVVYPGDDTAGAGTATETAAGTDTGAATGVDTGATPAGAGAEIPQLGAPSGTDAGEERSVPGLMPTLRISSLKNASGRLAVPAPLYGSREILLHQNEMADRDGLDRVQDEADLLDLRRKKQLVALPVNSTMQIDERLPEDRRYTRPWTAEFLEVLSRDFFATFHQPLQVTSAVRTVEIQKKLERTNGNAAPSEGETASPHLTGEAVDIAKHGLSLTEVAWMRAYLEPLMGAGKIDVEEEFRQACFHVSVYRSYLPGADVVAARGVAGAATP
jgi:uncharacterized protein YcbK (DUF882 family)